MYNVIILNKTKCHISKAFLGSFYVSYKQSLKTEKNKNCKQYVLKY